MRILNLIPGATAVTLTLAVTGLTACYGGYSSGSYAVAGAFAATAAALQIAEGASQQPSIGSCSTQTCGGCCDARGTCLSGAGDSACGAGGGSCADCTMTDDRCAGGACKAASLGSVAGPSADPSSAAACEIASCPRCALGSACCSAVGVCACSIGNLCP